MTRVAVIGAGIAGTTAARALADAGARVVVFEKSRGAGGRTSTRRAPPHAFDHGAQFFTTREPAFCEAVAGWVAAGIAATWPAHLVDIVDGKVRSHPSAHARYVGVPGMSAIGKHLLGAIRLHRETRIEQVAREEDAWRLLDDAGGDRGTYDVVLVTAPPSQARALLQGAPELQRAAESARMAPCWTWLAAFDEPTGLAFDGAHVRGGACAWIARDASKPGREPPGETWVVQATPAWTRAHLETPPEAVAPLLETAFGKATGYDGPAPASATVHRWLYALVERPVGRPFLWDPASRIGACGDWLLGARVESAWTSGRALAQEILTALR